jgi:hypothetical protein
MNYMRKQLKQPGILLVLMLVLASCSKSEDIKETAETVGISTIVFFPTIEANGETLIILPVGGTFTDAGATAKLGDKTATYTTTGTVDVNTPGVYQLTYTAKNVQGFSVTDFRTVVIINTTNVAANNYSGTYNRWAPNANTGVLEPNGQTSTWTKISAGVYSIQNPGGATGLTVTGVNYVDNKIVVPNQHTSVGAFSSTVGTYNTSVSPPKYEWAIVNAGYGPAVRTFIKQ